MIELFKQPNLDWMGKAKYFYALSGILLLAGWISIFFGRGIKYGIDFSGGTNVDVRFAQPPSIDKIRAGLTAQGIGTSEIQPIRDISAKSSNEVLIFVEGKGQDEDLMQSSRDKVLNALSATYGVATSDKPDFNSNSTTPSSLAAVLTIRDPLFLSVNAGDRYQQLARKILDYRDSEANGILTNFDDLSKVPGVTPAVLTVFHDVLITLGFFSLLRFEISLTVIAALLTLVGYSMNDTIVIFDRIRENNRLLRRELFASVVN